ncbi:transglycosylase domain-containing protein [Streptomyces sp. NPDC060194]|uniref:transglycosylase domain-containing protein n=1 Tax=Streptomyces sp. NPDC060194 TaxID=3347069 RepID=UPI0036496EB1
MSEHRRKPPQPTGGGRAAARRGTTGSPSGRRAAPRGSVTGSPSAAPGEPSEWGGRAAARRAAKQGAGATAARPAGRRAAGAQGGGPGAGRGSGPAGKRLVDFPRSGRQGWQRWIPSWRQTTSLCLGLIGSMMAAAGIAYAMVGTPDPQASAKAQNNVFLWSDGSQMAATGGEYNRQNLDFEEIPRAMQDAVISAENKTFWQDKGVDPMGIGRALFNMARGGNTQGGSTITQQYVKNARLGDQSQTLSRKFKELFISIKVGRTEDKSEVLAGYLNVSYYGRGAYGLQAASRAYFDKDAGELDPSECALLATVLKGATYYDPAGATAIDPAATREANQDRAERRWKWILDQEVKDGKLTAQQRAKYTKFPRVEPPRKSAQLSGQTGYLVDLAERYILRDSNNTGVTKEDLVRGGYTIQTTFDKKKVNELEKAVKKVRAEHIKPKLRPTKDTFVQFGGASVDPKDGAIVAIYGGEDATKHFSNNADYTGAQIGSTFKPFVLAAAMRDGVRNPDGGPEQSRSERTQISPKSLYSSTNKLKIQDYDGSIWTNEKGEQWRQANDGQESYGEAPKHLITLREAMKVSANSPFVQLGMDVGLDKVRQAAEDAGLSGDNLSGSDYPSFSIGTSDPSAIRMAGAYSTFAASGKQHDPYSVKWVKDGDDKVFEHDGKPERAFDPEIADNVTNVLKTVVDEGTGTTAKLPGREVAGKTGTTDGNKSAWFVGYTPQLSTAISMYRLDDAENSKTPGFQKMFGTGGQDKIHGSSFPAEIWHDYMADAMKGKPVIPFPGPQPLGEIIGTPPPAPTPTPTPTPTPSDTPTPTPTPSPSSPSPSQPSPSCRPFDWQCEQGQDGGADGGGDNGGNGGQQPVTPTPSLPGVDGGTGDDQGNDNQGQDNGGGFFGGPGG